MENKEMLLALSKALKNMAEGDKQVGNVHTAATLHGPGGMFSTFGLEREVITAHLQPMGLASELPLIASMDTDPRFASVTGVTASDGTQPDHACDAAPTAYMKGCNLTARFGMIRFDTNTIEYDAVLTRYNRGDFMDLQMMGSMINDDALRSGIMPPNLSESDILNVVTLNEMLVAGVQTQREIVRQTWQGTWGVNNEFPGLDVQITTGVVDADIPGLLCPALDSDVKSFGYDDVCGTGRDVVEYLSALMLYLENNAQGMGLNPVVWKIVVRKELWLELSACWPCRYLTNRCTTIAGNDALVINDELNVNMRDKMRSSLQIPVNGIWYDVVLDDGIFEHNIVNNGNLEAGEYASTIYAVPMTILGGFPVTYRQYLNYNSPIGLANISAFSGQRRPDFWTDNGVFSWAYDGQLWCYLLGLKTEQRVVLRTPQLAGRIDYVKYVPTQHLRSPYPDSEYFMDGGVSIRPARSTYASWM